MRIDRRDVLAAGASALAAVALAPDPRAEAGVTIRMRSENRGGRVFFDPLGVHVPAGTRVRWICESGVHTATAYHPANGGRPRRVPPGAPDWDSGYLQPGDAFTVVLDMPGVYDFFCRPHERAGMVGRLVVGTPGAGAAAGYDGGGLPAAAAANLPDVRAIIRAGAVAAS